jgi:hypothetical protein
VALLTVYVEEELLVLVPAAEVCQYQVSPDGGVPLKLNVEVPQSFETVGTAGAAGSVFGEAD